MLNMNLPNGGKYLHHASFFRINLLYRFINSHFNAFLTFNEERGKIDVIRYRQAIYRFISSTRTSVIVLFFCCLLVYLDNSGKELMTRLRWRSGQFYRLTSGRQEQQESIAHSERGR